MQIIVSWSLVDIIPHLSHNTNALKLLCLSLCASQSVDEASLLLCP